MTKNENEKELFDIFDLLEKEAKEKFEEEIFMWLEIFKNEKVEEIDF